MLDLVARGLALQPAVVSPALSGLLLRASIQEVLSDSAGGWADRKKCEITVKFAGMDIPSMLMS